MSGARLAALRRRQERLQLAAGAVGDCTATLGEAGAMVDAGIPDVLVTTSAVGANNRRLMCLARSAQGLMIVADHPGDMAALVDAATARERGRQLRLQRHGIRRRRPAPGRPDTEGGAVSNSPGTVG